MKLRGFTQRTHEGTEFPFFNKAADSFKKKYSERHIALLKMGLIFITLALLGALIHLQIIYGNHYRNLAEKNRIRIKEVKPLRGIIYDRNREPLVKNQPNFNLLATPFDIYQQHYPVEKILTTLKEKYPASQELDELANKLRTINYVPVILKKNLNYEEGMELIPIIEKWPGVFLQETIRREYPYGELLAHLLGYTGFVTVEDLKMDNFYSISDMKGKAGVEFTYEEKLRGVKGEKRVQIDSLGKENKTLNYSPSQKGQDIFLTIDLKLQEELNRILKKWMEEFSVQKAAALVFDPNNGEILSLISLPSFDNNLFTSKFDAKEYELLIDDPNKPLFNRAISGEYPPGSTFKLIVGTGALEEGIADENFTVTSVGGIRVGEWFFPDWLPQGHGQVNIKGALAWSVNTYFYIIGGGYQETQGLGLEGINKYAKMFYLGKLSGINLPGESTGLLPTSNDQWYLGDTYHLSIGQGDILVTPLQVALWTSFFANGGTLYQPHIVKQKNKILDKNFISSQNIQLIREGLRDTVRYGSARSLNSLNSQIAGKTGSAQFAKNKKTHGWFTGFAPFDNPQVVITIIMEEGDGAQSAVPVARDFFNWYFNLRS